MQKLLSVVAFVAALGLGVVVSAEEPTPKWPAHSNERRLLVSLGEHRQRVLDELKLIDADYADLTSSVCARIGLDPKATRLGFDPKITTEAPFGAWEIAPAPATPKN